METKPEITHSDSVIIQGQTEKLKSQDSELRKKHHYPVFELVDEEDLGTLEREQAQLDDHEDKRANMMDRLIRLSHTKPSPTVLAPPVVLETSAEPSWLLHRRLNHMESTLRSINLTVESLTPGPDPDICLVWQLEEQVSRINAEHSDLTRHVLSLEYQDRDLLSLSLDISKTLFDLSVQIKGLLRDQAAPPPTKETKSGVKLPKMNVPTFDCNMKLFNAGTALNKQG